MKTSNILPADYCLEEEQLIAKYMGEEAIGGYHQSWDWLMPVIIKINANGFFFFWESYIVRICGWQDGSGEISKQAFFKESESFAAVYKCVVMFLHEVYPIESYY